MKEFKKGKEFFRYVNRWWLLGWFFTYDACHRVIYL